jgi:SPW repeat
MADLTKQSITSKWQDWLSLVLAAWLFISPWVLQFAPGTGNEVVVASWNAWILAIVIGVFSIATLVRAQPWEDWVNIIAGAWVFVSPWVLSYYAGHVFATWNAFIVGALVFALAIWDLNTNPEMAGRRA